MNIKKKKRECVTINAERTYNEFHWTRIGKMAVKPDLIENSCVNSRRVGGTCNSGT